MPRITALSLVALSLLASTPALAAYDLTKRYEGDSFFSDWEFYGHYDNLTNGDIDFVNSTGTDLAYVNSAGNAIIKVDNTSTVLYPNKRRSVRLESSDTYGIGSMVVFDFNHVPYGCSVWPAAWLSSATWPQGGEIDVFEGVNLQSTNQYALHTSPGFTASTSSSSDEFTGNLTYANCDTTVNSNSGCTVTETNTASYGEAFAAAGGGVWAAEMGKDAIKIWFFSRDDVPSDLLTSNTSAIPNPDGWGTPSANYPGDISEYFSPQHLIIDITACGDWAGAAAVINQTCPLTTDLCYTSFVLDSSNFNTAYFEIPSIRVYYDSDKAADSAARTTATSTSSSGASGVSSTSGASASGSSGTSGAKEGVKVGKTVVAAVTALTGVALGAWTIL
ncbi:hypothetical protein JCM8547_005063 [Rhodosporidiobolus lusitaniae]